MTGWSVNGFVKRINGWHSGVVAPLVLRVPQDERKGARVGRRSEDKRLRNVDDRARVCPAPDSFAKIWNTARGRGPTQNDGGDMMRTDAWPLK